MQTQGQQPRASGFPVRRMDFDFAAAEKYIYANQPATSFFMIGMQAYFPDGEQFFIDSVRHYRAQILDPQLQRDIGAFIGQEAMHGKEHRAANDALTEQGVAVQAVVRFSRWMFRGCPRFMSARQQLALTVALEHFTAIMGAQMLSSPRFMAGFSDPRLQRLVLWHAVEECEHKAVAFDTYQQTGGGYGLRCVTMAYATLGVALAFVGAQAYLLAKDGSLSNLRSWWHSAKTLFGRQGLFSSILGNYLAFYRPTFNPSQHDTRALEQHWKAQLGFI